MKVVPVAPRDPFPTEITSAFTTAAALAKQVRSASRQRRFPLVLAGNCIASLGVVSGMRPDRRGVVWIDPVGDLERPHTTRSGILDRMALATILGHAWPGLSSGVPGFAPVQAEQLLLIGGDALEVEEANWVRELALPRVKFSDLRRDVRAVGEDIERLNATTDRIHLHVDMRSVAASEGGESGGLLHAELVKLVRQVASRTAIASATIASYDPARDLTGTRGRAANDIIDALVDPQPPLSNTHPDD